MRMSRQVRCMVLAALGVLPVRAAENSVTLLLDIDGQYSPAIIEAAKRETLTVLEPTGLQFEWRMKRDLQASANFGDLVMVKFKGHCRLDPVPFLYDERGPLAYTHSTDGSVLPFTEVECDKVRQSVLPVIRGQGNRAEVLLGRALGRVLAHEIYHVLAGTHEHTNEGVTRRALRASALLAEHLDVNAEGLERIRKRQHSPAQSTP